MPIVRFLEENEIYRYFRFDEYDAVSATGDELVLEYNGDAGPFDAGQSPWQIVMRLDGAGMVGSPSGPQYSMGIIDRVEFVDQSGNTLIRMNNLSVELTDYQNALNTGQMDDFFDDFVNSAGNVYIGSEDASINPGIQGDSITTGAGDDRVRSGGGDDLIKDYGGTDIYKGGSGQDTVSYQLWNQAGSGATMGIEANLAGGTILGPDGNSDRVDSIEGVIGTQFDDRIIGNGRNNIFNGLDGDDYFNGRGAYDTVSYAQSAEQGIRANLETNFVEDAWGDTDRLRNIEGIEGTEFDDFFFDNGGGNTFVGRGGDDVMRLSGGSDYVEGNAGADTFIIRAGATGEIRVRDYDASEGDALVFRGLTDFDDLTIRQSGSGQNAVILFEDVRVVLREFNSADLTADDFGLV